MYFAIRASPTVEEMAKISFESPREKYLRAGTYLPLAISLSCEFVTADEKFCKVLETTKLKRHLLWIGDVV